MIATNDFVVHEEETMKGKWHDFFENENPIHIEVGMGKGRLYRYGKAASGDQLYRY